MNTDTTNFVGHTPGPWKKVVGQGANSGVVFIDGNEGSNHHKQSVCRIGVAYSVAGDDCREQNTALLLAAPALLAERDRLREAMSRILDLQASSEPVGMLMLSTASIRATYGVLVCNATCSTAALAQCGKGDK